MFKLFTQLLLLKVRRNPYLSVRGFFYHLLFPYSLLPTPYSLSKPYSLLPTPYSLSKPYSLLPTHYSLSKPYSLLICTLTLGSLLTLPVSAEITNSAVRRVTVPQSDSTSTLQNQPIPIKLAPGFGVNISFIPTGEVVEKVWLDNPSFIALDVDGCLSGLGEEECEQNGATVVHLRRINQLDIPGLPKTDSTLLTVITRSQTGQQLYLFKIVRVPQASELVVELVKPTLTPNLQLIEAVERGVQRALIENLLTNDSPLKGRLDNFISLLHQETEVSEAARRAGVSMELVERLVGRGVRSLRSLGSRE